VVKALADVLHPSTMYPWSNMAMHYLGVPIIVSVRCDIVRPAITDADSRSQSNIL
jgi:hypothetical protein